MSVFNTLLAARPHVDPMPLADRTRIRESLFGIGHADAANSVRARSDSGAVVSTAAHGTRARAPQAPHRVRSAAKAVAGIAGVALIAAVVWSFVGGDDSADQEVSPRSTRQTTILPPTSTAPATTAEVLARTPVSGSEPLVVPGGPVTVDEVTVTAAAPGASSGLIVAPDNTVMWLAEFDGDPAPTDGLEIRAVGSIEVGADPNVQAGAAVSYRLSTPCGSVLLNDAPGAPIARPEIVSLLESMSIDASANVAAALPAGFSVLDIGAWQPVYSARFQVPAGDTTQPVQLLQIPNGSISQLTFGGSQLTPITFAGEPAFLDAAPSNPNVVSIFWKDASTVFNISSEGLDQAALETFVSTFQATTVADWDERFATVTPAPLPLSSSCVPQPGLSSTLNP